MKSRTVFGSFCKTAVLLAVASALEAQSGEPHVVSPQPPQGVVARRGAEFDLPLQISIRDGYHINSNAPADEYLIPTALTWSPGPLALRKVSYPKAESVQYEFSEKPMQVYSGLVTLGSRFAVAADAPKGAVTLAGKLRYQACNDKMCLPPRTLDLTVALRVE